MGRSPWDYRESDTTKATEHACKQCSWASLVAQLVKNHGVLSLGWEDPLEKEIATHPSICAWEIPWTEEPGRYSPGGHKELDTTERTRTHPNMLMGCVFLPTQN